MNDHDFLEESQTLDSAALATLQGKLSGLTDLRTQIAEVESHLKELKKEEMKRSREDIPSFLLQFGINRLDLDNGMCVTIKEDIACTVPKTDMVKRQAVMNFLIKNGGGGLIKDKVQIEDPTVAVMNKLEEDGVQYARTQDVNTSSLKAFVRGLLGLKKNTVASVEVSEVPKELNLYVYRETKVTGV